MKHNNFKFQNDEGMSASTQNLMNAKKKKKRKKNWETKTHVRIIKSNIVKEDKNKVNEPINMLKVAVPLARTKQVEPATSWTILLPSTAEQQLPPT